MDADVRWTTLTGPDGVETIWRDVPVWRSIETAPRDGTNILLFVPSDDDGEIYKVAHWLDGYRNLPGGWSNGRSWWHADDPDDITGWMPLPAPPAMKHV